MTGENGTMKSWMSGSIWSDVETLLLKGADLCNVEMTIRNKTRRFFTETVFFTVRGSRENISVFTRALDNVIKKYNNEG